MEAFELFSLWVRLFKKRRDIRLIPSFKPEKPVPAKGLAALAGNVPADVLTFATRTRRIFLQWNHVGAEPWHRLEVRVPEATAWFLKPDTWVGTYAERAVLQEITPERRVVLSRTASQTREQAEVVYDAESEGADGRHFGGLLDYLATGARAAFVTGWQRSDALRFPSAELTRLREASLTVTTRDDVVAALQTQGATPEEAAALWDWIGEACVLVLPATLGQAKAKAKTKAEAP